MRLHSVSGRERQVQTKCGAVEIPALGLPRTSCARDEAWRQRFLPRLRHRRVRMARFRWDRGTHRASCFRSAPLPRTPVPAELRTPALTPDGRCDEAKSRRIGPPLRGSGQRRRRDVSGSRPPSLPWLAHRGGKHVGATVSLELPPGSQHPWPDGSASRFGDRTGTPSLRGNSAGTPLGAAMAPFPPKYNQRIPSPRGRTGGFRWPKRAGAARLRGGRLCRDKPDGPHPSLPAPVSG